MTVEPPGERALIHTAGPKYQTGHLPTGPSQVTSLVAVARSAVGDGDDADVVRGVDVPVPDAHGAFFAVTREGGPSNLILGLIRQAKDRHARVAPGLVADLGEEVTS